MLAQDPEIEAFADLLRRSRRVAVFTGAGISTESGIPDFRSPGGVWSRSTPVQFDDFVSSVDARREAWRQKLESSRDMHSAQPNRGHRAVEHLVRDGKVAWVITQNIDGLHQRSGVPAECVIELHGNSTYATCLDCGLRHELAPILDAFGSDGTLPHCGACGGLVKTATISFGQAMPVAEMERAQRAAEECDLFIAIGTSLVVWPAAGFPVHAKRSGARLVILNREPTDLDAMADLVLNREIGPTLGFVVNVN